MHTHAPCTRHRQELVCPSQGPQDAGELNHAHFTEEETKTLTASCSKPRAGGCEPRRLSCQAVLLQLTSVNAHLCCPCHDGDFLLSSNAKGVLCKMQTSSR